VYFNQFQTFAQELNNRVLEAHHLTDEQRGDIMNKYGDMEKYLNDIRTILTQKKHYEDPGYSIDDVHNKFDQFKTEVNHILNSPPQS